jgi:metal-responsive CopG/Arc/MetJ family transcriptional regulator
MTLLMVNSKMVLLKINEKTLAEIAELAEKKELSRTSLIRMALREYINQNKGELGDGK